MCLFCKPMTMTGFVRSWSMSLSAVFADVICHIAHFKDRPQSQQTCLFGCKWVIKIRHQKGEKKKQNRMSIWPIRFIFNTERKTKRMVSWLKLVESKQRTMRHRLSSICTQKRRMWFEGHYRNKARYSNMQQEAPEITVWLGMSDDQCLSLFILLYKQGLLF